MATKLGEAYVDITARLDDYNKRLKLAEEKLSSFSKTSIAKTKTIGDSFSALGKRVLVAYASIKSMALIFNKVIKPASDFEESLQKFNVIFKDVGKEAMAMAESIRESYGLSRDETITLLGNTGDLLTGFGATGEEALNLSAKVQKLAADTASFSNIAGGTAQASRALTAALLGEREQVKQLGIVIRQTDVDARLAAEGKDKLTGKAKLLATAEVTLAIATEQSKNAIGDFARSSDSAANVARRLSAVMKDVAVDLGQQLLPGLNDLGRTMLVVAKDGGPLYEFIKDLFSAFGKLLTGMSNVANGMNVLLGNMNKIGIAQKEKFNAEDIEDWSNKSTGAFGRFSKEGENIAQTLIRIRNESEKGGLFQEGISIEDVESINDLLGEREGILQRSIDNTERIAKINKSIDDSRKLVFKDEKEKIDKNANARLATRDAEIKGIKTISENWTKAREEATKFIKNIFAALESPEQKILRIQEEQLAKIEEYKNKKLITEKEYADGVVAINIQAENQLAELRQKRYEENLALSQETLGKTGEFLALIGEASSADDENRLASIDAKKEKKLDQLKTEYEAEKEIIKKTIKNSKKQQKALDELEEKTAAKEIEIQKKADKEKGEIQRKAFERDKGFRIVQTIIATSQAIMSALAGPFPASIAFAALAGVMGAIQLGIIAASKPPAMAEGGIVNKETLATIGEAGTEAVLPLSGPQGARTREMFANDLIAAIAAKTERQPAATVDTEPMQAWNVTVNIGSEKLYTQVTQAISNREILIDERALVRR